MGSLELDVEDLRAAELRARCEDVSPSVLSSRLGELRDSGLVELTQGEGYSLTKLGRELGAQLSTLDRFARRWARSSDKSL